MSLRGENAPSLDGLTDPVSPVPSAVSSVQSRKRLLNSPTSALTVGLAHSPRVLRAVRPDVTDTLPARDLFGWMDNSTLGGEPSTSHALHTPCSLMHPPKFWCGEDSVSPGET